MEGESKTTGFLDLLPEIQNIIFEQMVVHRNQGTGGTLTIRTGCYMDHARRKLRPALTCRLFYNTLVPMYFGLNQFEAKQILKLGPFSRYFDHCEDFRGMETIWNIREGSFKSHKLVLPPANCRRLLRAIKFYIELPQSLMSRSLKITGSSESKWCLATLGELHKYGFGKLDTLVVIIGFARASNHDFYLNDDGQYYLTQNHPRILEKIRDFVPVDLVEELSVGWKIQGVEQIEQVLWSKTKPREYEQTTR